MLELDDTLNDWAIPDPAPGRTTMCDNCELDLDALPRAELGETELGDMPRHVSEVLDAWLFEQHGVASSHHGVGAFLDGLAAAGYRVTPIEVPAFADALPAAGKTCPRCGSSRPLGRWEVCAPCAAEMGWDPPCQACREDDAGRAASVPHVTTCGPGRGTVDQVRDGATVAGAIADQLRATDPDDPGYEMVRRCYGVALEAAGLVPPAAGEGGRS